MLEVFSAYGFGIILMYALGFAGLSFLGEGMVEIGYNISQFLLKYMIVFDVIIFVILLVKVIKKRKFSVFGLILAVVSMIIVFIINKIAISQLSLFMKDFDEMGFIMQWLESLVIFIDYFIILILPLIFQISFLGSLLVPEISLCVIAVGVGLTAFFYIFNVYDLNIAVHSISLVSLFTL